MTAQVAADLRAAAEVLRRDGWVQEEYATDCGRCALGALLAATAGVEATHPDEMSQEQRVEHFDPAAGALMAHLGFDYGLHIVDWNDEPGRTADEVIAALEAAADAAEADQ